MQPQPQQRRAIRAQVWQSGEAKEQERTSGPFALIDHNRHRRYLKP
jgi:hypothetical protein